MQKIMKLRCLSRQLLETVNFAFMKIFDSLVKIAVFRASLLFWGRLRHAFLPGSCVRLRPIHFKGCSYLNHKISFNLSVQVAIFLVFHNPFLMLIHILRSVLDRELKLDNFLIPSSVQYYLVGNDYSVLK